MGMLQLAYMQKELVFFTIFQRQELFWRKWQCLFQLVQGNMSKGMLGSCHVATCLGNLTVRWNANFDVLQCNMGCWP